MKKVVSMLLSLVLLLSLSACGNAGGGASGDSSGGSSNDVVKFAVVGPMTGANAEYGLGFRQSAQIMADKWNAQGGVNGKQIELVVYDDKQSAEEAANVAEQIVANDDIVAVIGHHVSTCSMAAAPIYQDHGMLEVSPCSSHADFTAIGNWIWRVSPLSSDEALSVSKFVVSYWDAKKVGILVMNSDWGLDISELETEYLKELNPNIEIVTEYTVEGNDDYGPIVTNFKNAGVDTIICAATYTMTAPFSKQMRAAVPEINLIAHCNCQVSQVTDILGADGDEFTCSASWSPTFTDDETKYYLEKYKEMDANDTTPTGEFAQYYDTMGVLLQACKNAGSFDREAICKELADIEYTGLSGILNFDEKRDCPRDYGIVQWSVSANDWIQNTEWNA